MSKLETTRKVNLCQCPEMVPHQLAAAGVEITEGDMHGNALKLLNITMRHGFLRLAENDAENTQRYNTFVELYFKNNEKLTKDDLVVFNRLLNELIANPQATGLLRLIGDLLAERGSNDIFTLKILAKLTEKGLRTQILISNHDYQFINSYNVSTRYDETHLNGGADGSAHRLQSLIDRGLVTAEEVKKLVDETYKPLLQALSYTLTKSTDGKAMGIMLHSHAPIDITVIEYMVRKLNQTRGKLKNAAVNRLALEFDDSSPENLAKTIDQINAVFGYFVKENQLHRLFDDEVIAQNGSNINPATHPFEFAIWTREVDKIYRKPTHKGYHVGYCNGHTESVFNAAELEFPSREHICNIDNELGKGVAYLIGDSDIVLSDEGLPKPAPENFFVYDPNKEVNEYDKIHPKMINPNYSEEDEEDFGVTLIQQSKKTSEQKAREHDNDELNALKSQTENLLEELNSAVNNFAPKEDSSEINIEFYLAITELRNHIQEKLNDKLSGHLNPKERAAFEASSVYQVAERTKTYLNELAKLNPTAVPPQVAVVENSAERNTADPVALDSITQKKLALTQAYETDCKAYLAKDHNFHLGKLVAKVVGIAACVALGVIAGALVYGLATAWTGPGAIVGAVIGALHGGSIALAAVTASSAAVGLSALDNYSIYHHDDKTSKLIKAVTGKLNNESPDGTTDDNKQSKP